jgi:hypothetical protein
MTPALFPAAIATLLVVLGVGAFAALLVGFVFHRRERDASPVVDVVATADETPDRTRLSA